MSEASEPSERELVEQMREQLAALPVGQVVAESAVPLVSLAYMRLGVPAENERYRELEAARVLIDALGGLLGAVEGRLGEVEPQLTEALASLRLTFAQVAGGAAGEPAGEAGARPGGPGPEQPPAPPRPSGLWVPGQP